MGNKTYAPMEKQIQEPMTMITDYLITLELIIFSILLFPQIESSSQVFVFFSFIFTSIAAALGGTAHGFKEFLTEHLDRIIWIMIAITIGLAANLLQITAIFSTTSGTLRRFLIVLVIIQAIVYLYKILTLEKIKFIHIIYNYVPAMLFSLILMIIGYTVQSADFALFLIFSIVISFVAAGIQMSGFSLHKHFNHNDLYHVVQMIGFYFLFLSSPLLSDKL